MFKYVDMCVFTARQWCK